MLSNALPSPESGQPVGSPGMWKRGRHGEPDGLLSTAPGATPWLLHFAMYGSPLYSTFVRRARVRPPQPPGRVRPAPQPVHHRRVVPRQHRAEQFPRRLVAELHLGGRVLAGVVPLGLVDLAVLDHLVVLRVLRRSATTAGTARPSGSGWAWAAGRCRGAPPGRRLAVHALKMCENCKLDWAVPLHVLDSRPFSGKAEPHWVSRFSDHRETRPRCNPLAKLSRPCASATVNRSPWMSFWPIITVTPMRCQTCAGVSCRPYRGSSVTSWLCVACSALCTSGSMLPPGRRPGRSPWP